MIGITGGIATGKSTVSKRLTKLGASVLDADKIARDVVEPGTLGYQKVAATFPEVIDTQGNIDRKRLGEIIFQDKEARQMLESIIHPLVLTTLQKEGKAQENAGKIVFLDIPLLYESKSDEWLDAVWVVYASPEIQLKRLMARDEISYEEAMRKIGAQMSLAEKVKRADRVIDNSKTRAWTIEQVEQLWKEFFM